MESIAVLIFVLMMPDPSNPMGLVPGARTEAFPTMEMCQSVKAQFQPNLQALIPPELQDSPSVQIGAECVEVSLGGNTPHG